MTGSCCIRRGLIYSFREVGNAFEVRLLLRGKECFLGGV